MHLKLGFKLHQIKVKSRQSKSKIVLKKQKNEGKCDQASLVKACKASRTQ